MLRPNSPDVFGKLFGLGALCRSFQMAGALETVLRMCVEHANVRVQFGKPIAQFQAVRQQIAALAGQAAAASRAADLALEAVMCGGGENEIAVAKARAGEAAGIAAAIAHQVHGAMGITYEHALHQYTRRLWAWRDDFGNERYWQRKLGAAISSRGADNLWQFLTGT
jgi:acyl-CoA dehydrogenase